MFKFVHVCGFGFKGKSDSGRALRNFLSAVGERLCGARPKKNWVGGRGRNRILAKSGPEKKSPWAV